MLRIPRVEIDKFIWSIYMFVAIFAPPFMPYPHLALSIFSLLLLLTKYRPYAKEILIKSGIQKWATGIAILGFYTCSVPLAVSLLMSDIVDLTHYTSIINRFGVLAIVMLACGTVWLCKIRKVNYDYHFVVEVIIRAGLIEGMCSVFAFISPTVKNAFIALMRFFNGSTLYDNTWYITVRSYGFASTLVDLFGLGIAIIAGMSFFYGVTEKRQYIFYSMIIAIAAALNARTGLILYLVAILMTLVILGIKGKIKYSFRSVVSIVVIIATAGALLQLVATTNTETYGWINNAIRSVTNFFETGTVDVNAQSDVLALLLNQRAPLPGVFRSIIGTAHSLYLAEGYKHSDIGYINDIWIFGIIGCVILYGRILKLSIGVAKQSRNLMGLFEGLFVPVAFIIFNFKGAAIGYNPGAAAIFFVLFSFTFLNNRQVGLRSESE